VRDLFERYGLIVSTAGVPLADWGEDDQATIMQVWTRVKLRITRSPRRPCRPSIGAIRLRVAPQPQR
jgi:hypothetical protein